MVRTAQWLFPSIYVTAEQAKEIDAYRHSTPASYGCTLDDFARTKRLLEGRLGRPPAVREVIEAVNDSLPATEAQLAYAKGVGLRLPTRPTKNHVSYLLHSYEALRDEIRQAWRDMTGRDLESGGIQPMEIGALVSDLLESQDFLGAVRRSGEQDPYLALGARLVRERLLVIMRQRWARYLHQP